ncbi:MAG: hypothetical protein K6B74_06675 [Ruminococcus sp.]|nr:hypothetical protein [Ruminococcus sp.]
MIKAFKKLGGFFAALLIGCTVSLTAIAYETDREEAEPEIYIGEVQIGEEEFGAVSCSEVLNAANQSLSKDFFVKCAGSRWGYNELAQRSNGAKRQQLYDRMLDEMVKIWNRTDNLNLVKSEDDNYNYELAYIPFSDIGLTREEAKETFNSFLYDNPIFYYISKKYGTGAYKDSNGKYKDYVVLCTYKEYMSASARAKYQSEIEKYVKQAAGLYKASDSAFNNAMRLHDKILDTITYSSVSGNALYDNYYHSPHNIIGALIYGKGVCESYAKLYQIVNGYCGLDSIYVVGKGTDESGRTGNHVWNLIKLDDGYYYCFDATWDEGSDKRKYFAKGTDTFLSDHKPLNSGWSSDRQFLYGLPYNIAWHNYEQSKQIARNHTHSFGEWKMTKKPNCTEDGTEQRICSCNYVQTRAVCATGHSFKGKIISADCTTSGMFFGVCSVCGFKYTEKLSDATGHQYTTKTIAPTCTEDGYTLQVCSVCGDSKKTKTVKATGHKFASEKVSATCTEDGGTLKKCMVCGYSVMENTEKAKGHTYSSKTVSPTCTEAGYTEHTCVRCGDKYIDSSVPAKGHSFTDRVVPPTKQSGGYTEHTCSVCGIMTADSFTAPLGGFLLANVKAALPAAADLKAVKATVYSSDGTKLFDAQTDANGAVYGSEKLIDGKYFIELGLSGCAKRRCSFRIKYGVSGLTDVLLCARGDLDGSGTVNVDDLVIMQRLIAGWKLEAVYSETADTDGNGAFEVADLTLLQKYISGWKVKLN